MLAVLEVKSGDSGSDPELVGMGVRVEMGAPLVLYISSHHQDPGSGLRLKEV